MAQRIQEVCFYGAWYGDPRNAYRLGGERHGWAVKLVPLGPEGYKAVFTVWQFERREPLGALMARARTASPDGSFRVAVGLPQPLRLQVSVWGNEVGHRIQAINAALYQVQHNAERSRLVPWGDITTGDAVESIRDRVIAEAVAALSPVVHHVMGV